MDEKEKLDKMYRFPAKEHLIVADRNIRYPDALAGSGVFGEKEKSVMVQSKKEKVIAVGVKNRHFGVKNGEIDSHMLSMKNVEISLA